MRIPIREQLGLLVLLTSLVSLMIISIATWVNNYNFVVGIKSQGLSLTASLKAAQIASDLQLLQSTCSTIVTRILIQRALSRFYQGNNTDANWSSAVTDVQSALSSGGYSSLLQVVIYPRNNTGNINGLLNVTASTLPISLPYNYSNGTVVTLGDDGPGYPPQLYPNLTFTTTSNIDPGDPTTTETIVQAFPDYTFGLYTTLVLGPLLVNTSLALLSMTIPIINNTSAVDILGYMTVVASASQLLDVLSSREGLDNTGVALLLGPAELSNQFSTTQSPSNASYLPEKTALQSANVRFVFPPTPVPGQADRHSQRSFDDFDKPFTLKTYPAALDAFALQNPAINNASSTLSTTNEQGESVAVGYARPQSNIVDWLLVIEQDHNEAWEPVVTLRNILLACVFGTMGGILLLLLPVAHYSVLPIRRLRDATEKSVQPPGYTPNGSIRSERMDDLDGFVDEETGEEIGRSSSQRSKRKTGFLIRMRDLRYGRRKKSKAEQTEDARRRVFKIPGKVLDRKHWITDELTELTGTFNEMSDELMMQYGRLEERVEERTRELEISKKAAEAANESKTLFIANISHELKTPLNGILGMCAVCMGEDDLPRIKRSLQVVYKSGDLLLHLLNDLLTFSKNQIGQSISIEEKEFSLSDIKSQITTIFDKQVRDGHIKFDVKFLSTESADFNPERVSGKPLPALGPAGTGRLKDMRLWGDQHRILQVIINLVSNSLKFTPEGGKVEVRIRCVGENEKSSEGSRKDSMGSKSGSQRPSRNRHRIGSGSNNSVASRVPSSSGTPSKPMGTALLINPMDPKAAKSHVQMRERSPTPPPTNARTLIFEFEVEDSGPGIPPSLQERVFEPFVQGDLGLNKKYGGTGLGLSICSQLAGLMGGNITLESTVGVGSTFNMRIPLKFVRERASSVTSSEVHDSRASSVAPEELRVIMKTSGDANSSTVAITNSQPMGFEKDTQPRLVGLSQPFFAAAASPDPSSSEQLTALDLVTANKVTTDKIRVLVAEDNLVNQEVVLRMLKLEDIYDVTVAKDGQEAYEMVKASMANGEVFNLIFMDIQMPNLDGLQSTRLIREMGYSAPIVALTAFSEESNIKDCESAGMNMFLSKPIRRPALKQVLKKFATIPEEAETLSLTRKDSPEGLVETSSVESKKEPFPTNGTLVSEKPS